MQLNGSRCVLIYFYVHSFPPTPPQFLHKTVPALYFSLIPKNSPPGVTLIVSSDLTSHSFFKCNPSHVDQTVIIWSTSRSDVVSRPLSISVPTKSLQMQPKPCLISTPRSVVIDNVNLSSYQIYVRSAWETRLLQLSRLLLVCSDGINGIIRLNYLEKWLSWMVYSTY